MKASGKIQKGLIGLLLWLMCSTLLYANTNTLIQQQIIQGRRFKAAHHTLVQRVQSQKRAARYAVLARKIARLERNKALRAPQDKPQALVFVSLGMPKKILKQILREAHAFHIPVVVRGLLDHSFRKTVAAIFNLNKKSGSEKVGGVLINPVWFRQFRIRVVPAVVVVRALPACVAKTECPVPDFDVVRGNVSLRRALEIIARQGEAAPEVAQQILERYAHA